MAKHSTGKHAYIIDDRTGWKIPYRDARTEWNGMRVHKDQWEPKHPQLTPPRIAADNLGLRNPRPDNDASGDSNVNYNQFGREGVVAYSKVAAPASLNMTCAAAPSGVSGTASTNAITLGITTDIFPEGVQATVSVNSVTCTVSKEVTGVSGTTAITAGVGAAAVTVTHFASTAHAGTVTVILPGYGMGTYNSGTWGI